MTPLQIAIENSHLDVIQLLLERRADIEKPNKIGNSPLATSMGVGKMDIVEVLLRNRADVNRKGENGILADR